jgi:hypothetical protein
MSFQLPFESQEARFCASTLLHVNKGEFWFILSWCWMVSAEAPDIPRKRCVWSRAGQSFGCNVWSDEMYMNSEMNLWCFRVSI